MILKKLSLISVGILLGVLIASCGASGLKVKVYYLDKDQGGLIRKQSNEVVPFDQAKGYYCMNPVDAEAVFTQLKACQSGGK